MASAPTTVNYGAKNVSLIHCELRKTVSNAKMEDKSEEKNGE